MVGGKSSSTVLFCGAVHTEGGAVHTDLII